jgi:hypothetical protein
LEVTVPDTRPPEPTPSPAPTAPPTAATPATAGPGTALAPEGRPVTPAGTQGGGTPSHWVPPPQAALHGPWPTASFGGRRWPGPARDATPATVLAIGVAAAIAAVGVPLDRAGVGWLITAIAGVAALVISRRMPGPVAAGGPAPLVPRSAWSTAELSVARFGWTAATVALLGVGTVRAAGWLFLLCLFAAALTGALAVGGGRSLRAMTVAAAIAPIAALRALPWAARGLAAIRRRGPDRTGGARVAATVAVSVALLVVFGALFASADAAFAKVLTRALPDISGITVFRWCFVGAVATAVLFGAAFLRAAPPDLSALETPRTTRVRRLEWAVPLGALVLLFAAFVAVQVTVLFAGAQHIIRTDGLTFAAYARSGFWQLLVVTGLTLGVLAGAARWAPRGSRTDRVLIRVLLGALSVLTLVIVASALHRMNLYADTYGLTRLRVVVALCELWLGTAFVMVLIAGIRLTAPWLPRAIVAAGVLGLLGLAAANPDALIAQRNIARLDGTQDLDAVYLRNLSADAVPVLDRLDPAVRPCVLVQLDRELRADPDDWRGWNAGRQRARNILHARPVGSLSTCPDPYRPGD